MEKNYIDESGVENAACALIRQAKKDFIRGAKVLYFHIGKIPPYQELMNEHPSLTNNEAVRWMYDSWRFVRNDPYELFSPGETSVINAWKTEAILDHYRSLYLVAGAILYKKKAPKEIESIEESELSKYIDDQKILNNFIEARNYIFTKPDAKEIFHQWDVESFARSRKLRLNGKKSAIQDSDYIKKAMEKRAKNIIRAKELREDGISPKAIAKELGVTIPAVWNYLRS